MTDKTKTLRAINSPTANEVGETLLLLNDTRKCFQAMKLWFRKYAPVTGEQLTAENDLIADALFRDSIVQFVANFDRTANYPLDEKRVFKQIDGGVEYFRWLKDIRDSYAAHKFGTLRQCVPGVVFDANGEALAIGHISQQGYPFGKEEEDQILRCMSVVGRYLEAKVENLQAKLLEEAKAMQLDEILRLPNAQTYATASDEIRMSRQKLVNLRQQAEQEG